MLSPSLAAAGVCAAEPPTGCDAATAFVAADDAVCAIVDVVPCVNPRDKASFGGEIMFRRSRFDVDENGTPEGLSLDRGEVGTGLRFRSLFVEEKGSPESNGEGEDRELGLVPVEPLFALVVCETGCGRP